MDEILRKKIALRVLIITITVNVALTAFKFIAGTVGHSNAMVSDAIHSFSDVASSIIVIIGVVIAAKPKDNLHQYGHERFECAASIILAVLLFMTGAWESYHGIHSLITGGYKTAESPTYLALIAAGVSILVKEIMFWYTYKTAKTLDSVSLKADAWHHRSDSLSSIGSLLGVGAAMIFATNIFDDIAALIICLFIFKVAISIFVEAIDKMVDKSCPEEFILGVKNVLSEIDGVLSVDEVKTRVFGTRIYVDVEIGAYENLSLKEAHKIAEAAHIAIENYDEKVKHCMVHVNPVSLITKENESAGIIKDETVE